MSMDRPAISVVVPTYKRPDVLRRTLEGLCGQNYPVNRAEILVICDGVDETTRAVAEAFTGQLPIQYREQQHQGVATARNMGIKLATAPVILFLDDDVVPGPDLLREHTWFHTEHDDERTVLLGYVTWHPDQRVTHYMRWYGEYGALFGFALIDEGVCVDPRFFYSCNISLKRKFLLPHDGFNETLTVMEDNELGFRLAADGMQLRHSKAAVGYHYQRFTFEQSCQRLARYSSGLAAFLATLAGSAMAKRRDTVAYRSADLMVRAVVPLLGFLRPLIDSAVPLPRIVYRMFYWYHGSYQAFWSKVGK